MVDPDYAISRAIETWKQEDAEREEFIEFLNDKLDPWGEHIHVFEYGDSGPVAYAVADGISCQFVALTLEEIVVWMKETGY